MNTPRSTIIGGAGILTPGATTIGAFGVKKTFDQLIKPLFANGEQGFFYDPNDLSTMFQDAAGTIPVTAVGQPVGLILDKSKVLIRGVERVDEQDLSKWASGGAYGNWPQSTATSDTITNTSSSAYGARSRRFAINGGQAFEASALVKCLTADSVVITLVFGTAGGTYITERPVPSTSKEFSKVSLRTVAPDNAASCEITIKVHGATGVTAQVKDISVKQVLGNHAYQTTSASRPILRQNSSTGAYYLEFDGSDDFLVTNSINFTATDKVSLFAGVRKLSDAVAGSLVELSTSTATQNGSFHLRTPTNSGTANLDWSSRGTVRVFATSSSVYTPPTSIVIFTKGDISGDSAILRVNGVQIASSIEDQGTGNYGNYPLYIGRRGGTGNPFNGRIYSLIGIGKLVSDSEAAAIEKELAKRTGVTLNV